MFVLRLALTCSFAFMPPYEIPLLDDDNTHVGVASGSDVQLRVHASRGDAA
jgi:hypothetical protein